MSAAGVVTKACPTFLTFHLIVKVEMTINTSTDNCEDGDVRLVDGDSSNEGRVELCLRRRWGSISDEEWSAEDAQVVCTQMGFSAKGS